MPFEREFVKQATLMGSLALFVSLFFTIAVDKSSASKVIELEPRQASNDREHR